MKQFALVTEGVTDYLVLKPILQNFFSEEPIIRQIRPEINDSEHETSGKGGFRQVLDFCKSDSVNEILKENDFVVIQIDSDVSPSRGFGIPHQVDGFEIDHIELYKSIIGHLKSLFPESVTSVNISKIIFAIGIHSIECWLIPILVPEGPNITHKCLTILNDELRAAGMFQIPKHRKNSIRSKASFLTLSKSFSSKKEITRIADYNIGFKKFVDSLEKLEANAN